MQLMSQPLHHWMGGKVDGFCTTGSNHECFFPKIYMGRKSHFGVAINLPGSGFGLAILFWLASWMRVRCAWRKFGCSWVNICYSTYPTRVKDSEDSFRRSLNFAMICSHSMGQILQVQDGTFQISFRALRSILEVADHWGIVMYCNY